MSTVNSSSPYTYGNYDNPGYASGGENNPPPVVNAREILAQRGTLPNPPPSGSYPGGAPGQLASILSAQNAARQANAQQRSYTQNLDNPSSSYYRQTNLRPVIAPQRTASTVSEAEQNFNDFITNTQQSLASLGSDVPTRGPPSGQSTYRFAGSIDAPTISALLPGGPTPKPQPKFTVEESAANLAKTDALRSSLGLAPLENSANIVNFSSGTNAFRANTLDTLNELTQAKNAGITSLDIFDQNGKKIGTTNPQDITRARYDILSAAIASGGPVSAKGSYKTGTNRITTTQTDYVRSNDNPLKSALASVVEPGAYIGLSVLDLPKIIGEEIKGQNPYTVGNQEEQNIQTQITKSIGPTYLDQILSGNYNSSNLTPAEKVASILGSGVGLYLTSGGVGGGKLLGRAGSAIKNVPSLIDDLAKGTSSDSGIISKIASGLKESNIIQNVGPRELVTGEVEKESPLRELTQGTVGKSGIESFTPTKVEPFYEENPVKGPGVAPYVKIEPGLPKGISEITDVTGIGPKGQPKVFSEPTEIKLEPGLEGQAKNPYALINPQGATAIVRSEPQDILPPNKLLVEFQGTTPLEAAGQAVHYGLEEVPGMKNVYTGSASAHTIERVAQGIKAGKLKIGTDVFQFGSKEFAKHPDIYGEVTRNPDLFKSSAFGKGGEFQSVSRPSVLRYLVGRGETEVKTNIGKNNFVRSNTIKPFSSGDFGISDIGSSKVGAGAAGRAVNLLKNTENLAKNFGNIKIEAPTRSKGDYLGPTLSNEQRQARGRGKSKYDLEYETYVYPKVLDTRALQGVKSNRGQRTVLLSNFGLDEVNKMINTGGASSLLNKMKVYNIGNTKTGDRINLITIPKTDLLTGTRTTQQTGQITIPVNIKFQPPQQRQPENNITLGGGWNWDFGFPTGNKKKRVNKYRPSFFVYSVNPNVPGAIAEAGQVGKLVSTRPVSFKGFGKVKGPNLGRIGKDILSGGRGRDKGGKSKRSKGSSFVNIDLGNLNLDLGL